MPKQTIRIATRQSKLALQQAEQVAAAIAAANPGVSAELVGMTTLGDRNKASPLSKLGGKGIFVKELETALLEGTADLAVHSMKDVPVELPPGLVISGMLAREDPRDALVCNRFASVASLPDGALLGSSSLRRCHQLRQARPAVAFKDVRGNVDTRLKKLDQGEYDALILAVAGLVRLGLSDRIAERIAVNTSIPAAGQGAIGMEARADDPAIAALISSVTDQTTQRCVLAERALTSALSATCTLPIAAFAQIAAGTMTIKAFVANQAGTETLVDSLSGAAEAGEQLGEQLGQQLIDQGALSLLTD